MKQKPRFMVLSKNIAFASIVLLCISHTFVYSLDVPEYSPEATVYFINEMSDMLETSPKYFPFNFSSFLEADGDKNNMKKGDSVTNNSRVAFSGNTILPLPFLEHMSISGGITLVGDSLDADSLDTMNVNSYASIGLIFDNPLLTLGLYAGDRTDLTFGERYDISSDGYITSSTQVTNAEDQLKIIFIPIIKTSELRWLSFLDSIANFINFGHFNPKDNLDYGQNYNFTPFSFGLFSATVSAYYKNERYSSIARNWIYGAELTIQSASRDDGFFVTLDGGYRNFYDFPVSEKTAFIKDSGFIIPGRGGVLDSVDSIAFAAPVFFIVYRFLF
jgi:hypothetical protein